MNILRIVPVVVVVLIVVLSRPAIIEALRGLLADRKELVLFAMAEAVAIGATALLLIAIGPQAAGVALLGCAALLLVWGMTPPAKRS